MGETAPGWYPDPSGKPMQRYFDGTEWTEHYAAAGLPAPAPPGPTAPAPTQTAPKKAPAKIGKYPAWAVVGAAVLVLMVGCIAINAGKKSTSSSSSASTSPSSTIYQPPAPPTISESVIESTVIDTCHQAITKGLKDPDSAKFGDDWKAWQVTAAGSTPPAGMDYSPLNGDKFYNAAGSVNAKNSFGGYVGDQPYSCDAIVNTAGDVHARAHSLELPTP